MNREKLEVPIKIDTEKQKHLKSSRGYSSVCKDDDGWTEVTSWLPSDYDLCLVKTSTDKVCVAWVSGKHWDGLKLTKKDKVVLWKRKLWKRELED